MTGLDEVLHGEDVVSVLDLTVGRGVCREVLPSGLLVGFELVLPHHGVALGRHQQGLSQDTDDGGIRLGTHVVAQTLNWFVLQILVQAQRIVDVFVTV